MVVARAWRKEGEIGELLFHATEKNERFIEMDGGNSVNVFNTTELYTQKSLRW